MRNPPANKRITRAILSAVALVSVLILPNSAQADTGGVSPTVEQVACGPDGAMVVRLYRAYFGRVPDQAGLEYWSGILQRSDIHNVAHHMSGSQEYLTTWGNTSDTDYVVELLYNNLLSRNPDQGGLEYWTGLLSTVGRSEQVLFWIQSSEMAVKHPVSEPALCGGDGYSFRSIPGGEAVDVDYSQVDVKASDHRCSIASINANWLWLSGGGAGDPIGFAAIDGSQVPGTYTRRDRGIFGERYRTGDLLEERQEGPTNQILTSAVYKKGDLWLEHLDGWATDGERSEYGEPIYEEDATQTWRWAVGGITMAIGGQRWQGIDKIAYGDYTHFTRRHPFVAFKAPHTMTIGATTSMTSIELTDWLLAQGYTEIMKMDGGASAEFNKFGRTVVAGTGRNIPVWLGIGC